MVAGGPAGTQTGGPGHTDRRLAHITVSDTSHIAAGTPSIYLGGIEYCQNIPTLNTTSHSLDR